ncbi:MAG: coniferyl aldehyde dehydrogenase, partial [Gluconacetobacter diazotrophicus]|nr:coniferyl aldehyde dehydrogenase [Gluconacetobacter diazotrophicus]
MDGDGAASAAALLAVLERQRTAFRRDGAPGIAARRDALRRLDRMLLDGADAFGAAIAADFGHRAWAETVLAELAPLRTAIRFAIRRLPGWCRDRRAAVPASFRPGSARVVR